MRVIGNSSNSSISSESGSVSASASVVENETKINNTSYYVRSAPHMTHHNPNPPLMTHQIPPVLTHSTQNPTSLTNNNQTPSLHIQNPTPSFGHTQFISNPTSSASSLPHIPPNIPYKQNGASTSSNAPLTSENVSQPSNIFLVDGSGRNRIQAPSVHQIGLPINSTLIQVEGNVTNSITPPLPLKTLKSSINSSVIVPKDESRVGRVKDVKNENSPPPPPPPTLISTEAQTEDFLGLVPPPPNRNREQRKRERRERRRERHRDEGRNLVNNNNNSSTTTTANANTNLIEGNEERRGHGEIGLPDLLNLPPPPYSTLPSNNAPLPPVPPSAQLRANVHFGAGGGGGVSNLQNLGGGGLGQSLAPPPNCLPSPTGQQLRYHFSPPAPPITIRASRRSLRRVGRGIAYASEEEPKSCCGMSTSQAVSIRWFIIVIAVIGICCTVAGTALGAARSIGSQHLTLSLLMIGVGVVLLTVSAVAWRLTANESGSSSCRAMLGFRRGGSSGGDGGSEPNRVFVPRLAPSYGRPHHPYAAMMYPDFQYRPPPPSYQASMQEYRLRLLLLERSNPALAGGNSSPITMALPPPAYRPYNPNLRHGGSETIDYSRPPSYRRGESTLLSLSSIDHAPSGHNGSRSRRECSEEEEGSSRPPSLLSYLSGGGGGGSHGNRGGNRRGGGGGGENEPIVLLAPPLPPHPSSLCGEGEESGGGGKCRNSVVVEVSGGESEGEEGSGEKKRRRGGGGEKDGNLVRIVQTTDSSQVIGRDSVIVTVSGVSNNNLWANHHPPPSLVTNSNITHLPPHHHLFHHPSSSSSDNNEVQILAHL